MPAFASRLKDLRKSQGITQKQVAEGIGVAESYYQVYEYGKKEPTISKLEKLCRYFNVSADYLLGLSDEPTAHRREESHE